MRRHLFIPNLQQRSFAGSTAAPCQDALNARPPIPAQPAPAAAPAKRQKTKPELCTICQIKDHWNLLPRCQQLSHNWGKSRSRSEGHLYAQLRDPIVTLYVTVTPHQFQDKTHSRFLLLWNLLPPFCAVLHPASYKNFKCFSFSSPTKGKSPLLPTFKRKGCLICDLNIFLC